MAASTISRATWTDGSGGTVINNARLQADVYDKVDALVAAAITFGSTVSAEGFGTHSFSAGGTGGNIFGVRNSTSGTGNYGMLRVGNNSALNTGEFFATSSAYTPAADQLADCACIRGNGAGGVSIAATNASGQIRFYAGATPTERVRLTTTSFFIAPSGSFPTASDMFVLASTTPTIAMYESDQGADGKWWVQAASGGTWVLQTQDDARSGAASAITITRSGNSISTIAFGAPVSASSFSTNDLFFANGFALTEHFKVGIETPGMALLTPSGRVVLFVDETGAVHANELRTDLAELGWVWTTNDERAAMDGKA